MGQILEGALRVFGEKGFEDATVAAICAEAGISEPTLYEYFGSKEDVLFSISELYTRREFERFSELASRSRGTAAMSHRRRTKASGTRLAR
ncbi:MAG: helix-turn-helix transcriptional regulator [Deltaproteobacteria bacterium]|nr:helix-turn-helix transcriptional regulator [Deltaproteobacteria bacterium]